MAARRYNKHEDSTGVFSMTVMEKSRLYTAEDLWELSHSREYPEKRLDLIDGMLIEMPLAGGKHGGLALHAGRLIGNHVDENELGYVTAAGTGYRLFKNPEGKDTVLAPDVGFVRKDRLPDDLPDGYIPFAPDLAVEVVSPNDSAAEVHNKVMKYLKYGTRLVWVLYFDTESAVAYTPSGAQLIDVDGTLDGGGVVPELKIPMRKLFPK
jgi:Uma2 family endonuclease